MNTDWVGAPLPPELAARARQLVVEIRAGTLTAAECDVVAETVIELTEVALRHSFQRPVKILGLNAALAGIVEFGIASSVKTCRYGVRKVMPKLKPTQWSQLADFIEDALIQAPRRER